MMKVRLFKDLEKNAQIEYKNMLSMNQFGQNSFFFFIFYFSRFFFWGGIEEKALGIRNSSKYSY